MSVPVIVKASNAKEKIKNYQAQLTEIKRHEPNNKKKLRELENRIKGAKGEEAAAYQMEFLPEHHYIIHDIRLKHKNLSAQIDHLVISKKGFFLIETKNFGSDIEIDQFGHWQITLKDKTKIGIENPYDQSFRHAEVIKRLLKEIEQTPERVNNIPFFHLVALANTRSIIKSKLRRNERIVKVDQIPREIFNLSENTPDIFTLEEVEKLSQYLISSDKPITEKTLAIIPNNNQNNEQKNDEIPNKFANNKPASNSSYIPSYVPNSSTKKFTHNNTYVSSNFKKGEIRFQLTKYLTPLLKFGSISLIIAITGLIAIKKFFESIQTMPYMLMGLLFILSTYFIYKKSGKKLIISLIIGAVITSFFGIIPMKIMEFLYYLYFPAFEKVSIDNSNKATIILNWKSYVGTGLYGFLLGIFIWGLPNVLKTSIFYKRWVILSYLIAAIIIVIPFFKNDAIKTRIDEYTSLFEIEQAATTEVNGIEEYIVPNLQVKLAYKEDVGQEIIHMNLDDIENHGLQENQIVEVIGTTQTLSFPIKSNIKTDAGTIRIQKSIRDKLGVQEGEVLQIRVTK